MPRNILPLEMLIPPRINACASKIARDSRIDDRTKYLWLELVIPPRVRPGPSRRVQTVGREGNSRERDVGAHALSSKFHKIPPPPPMGTQQEAMTDDEMEEAPSGYIPEVAGDEYDYVPRASVAERGRD